MTEGLKRQHGKSMCVRVWLEVGHAIEPRTSNFGGHLALDWRVWVRGVGGHDISPFVHKVVFHLHPASAFFYPRRVLREPPYEISETGCASIEIPIHVYLKNSNEPKKIQLKYSLKIENSTKSNSESRCIYFDFDNPSDELRSALMQGGGEIIAKPDMAVLNKLLGKTTETPKAIDQFKFIEPEQKKDFVKKISKHKHKSPTDRTKCSKCSKCGIKLNADLKRQLRKIEMTDDEISQVEKFYMTYSRYEKSINAILLPLLSDSIYRPPELPATLRAALTSARHDYALL